MLQAALQNAIRIIDKNLLRISRILFRFQMRLTGNFRPSSYPYVTGDSFRALANHIYDDYQQLSPKKVKEEDIVFVGQTNLPQFFTDIHPQINSRYILICHNGDAPVDKAIADYIDDKVIHFFAQDVTYAHEKITPIPIGIENKHIHVNGVTPMFGRLRKKIQKKPPRRSNRIFFSFSVGTNPAERGPAKELFSAHSLMDTTSYFLSPRMHARKLMQYKFVASPPGNAIESSRTWEALYLRTIPIVKDFVAMQYFQSLGLPMWIVSNWNELADISEEMLEERYNDLIRNADFSALFMDFWIEKIKTYQK